MAKFNLPDFGTCEDAATISHSFHPDHNYECIHILNFQLTQPEQQQ